MGHRCNYVVRENGQLRLYYSHWGALTVARDFFFGLEATRAFLAEQEIVGEDHWVDDVFGEGGAALDLDGRVLTIFDRATFGLEGALLLELMQAVWAQDGFTVRDVESMIGIATAVGVPASIVEAPHIPRPAIDTTATIWNGAEDGYLPTLVVVDGTPRFCASMGTEAILELGADRVRELDRLPDRTEAERLWATVPAPVWEEPKGSVRARLSEAIVIDTQARRVEVEANRIENSNRRTYYAARWPGYELATFSRLDDVLARLALPDLAPDRPQHTPLDVLLPSIEGYLFASRSDPAELMATLLENADGEVVVNEHALVSPGDGRPDPAEANRTFRRAVEVVRSRRGE